MGIRRRLEEEFDYDIVDEFLDHFDVMTEVMEPTVIALDNDLLRREKIHELFRIFHNIKSATSFLKIDRIHLLAKLAEEVMERLRTEETDVDEKVIDWLLLVSDQMRAWSFQLSHDEDLENIDPKILKLPE
ncbi:Hpt domain-containing protein [Hydrogenimonas sp.]